MRTVLFIPQVICSYGDHREMISTGENSLCFHQSCLVILPPESITMQDRTWRRECWTWTYKVPFFHNSRGSLTCHKIFRYGTSGFTTNHRRKACCGFLLPLKSIAFGRVSMHEPRVQWQARANHYTTEDDLIVAIVTLLIHFRIHGMCNGICVIHPSILTAVIVTMLRNSLELWFAWVTKTTATCVRLTLTNHSFQWVQKFLVVVMLTSSVAPEPEGSSPYS
jgi:hypothetical protein